MKRCTYCFRYARNNTTFCTTCGRSFNVKICSRGHLNPRGVSFCAECGSGELSTPAPPAGWLFHVSEWVLRLAITAGMVAMILAFALGFIYALDWTTIAPRLALLIFATVVLYWSTTMLPGPIKKVSKFAGKRAWEAMTNRRKTK
jgi:hypothetical protein